MLDKIVKEDNSFAISIVIFVRGVLGDCEGKLFALEISKGKSTLKLCYISCIVFVTFKGYRPNTLSNVCKSISNRNFGVFFVIIGVEIGVNEEKMFSDVCFIVFPCNDVEGIAWLNAEKLSCAREN